MAKKKKRSNLTSFAGSLESSKEVKASIKRFNFKRAIIILLSTLAAFSLLEAVVGFEASRGMQISIITIVYYIIATILFLAIVFLNRGLSKSELTPEMLDEGTPPEEASRICSLVNRQKKIAKKLMLVLIPLVLSILLDMLYLFYSDFFKGIIDALTI